MFDFLTYYLFDGRNARTDRFPRVRKAVRTVLNLAVTAALVFLTTGAFALALKVVSHVK